MKILITGGSGLLGYHLNTKLSKKNDILTIYNHTPIESELFKTVQADITDFKALENIICGFYPDIVLHTAAITRNELVSVLPFEYVWTVNVGATKNLAGLCNKYNAKLIYTSTDLVYDGNSGSMLKESALLNPVSVYAATKLEAENEIKNIFNNFIILRTALLYGIGLNNENNFFSFMCNNLQNGKQVKLYYDQFRTPFSLENAAEIISSIVNMENSGEIINFGGSERVSRYELGEILCEEAGFNKDLLVKVSIKDSSNSPVLDVSMDTSKIKNYGVNQKSIRQSIREIIRRTSEK